MKQFEQLGKLNKISIFFRGKQLLGISVFCLFIIKNQVPMESCLTSALHPKNCKAWIEIWNEDLISEGLISENEQD